MQDSRASRALRVTGLVLFGCAFLGASLDKAAERWLREVHLLILPEEETAFRALATADDRKQFERIFWARRDPDPATPRNEMEDAVAFGRKRADDLFTSARERGSETGCGQVFLLLGEPLEVEGREIKEQFSSVREMREGARKPETWTYRSRRGDAASFTGGELRIAFDEDCRFSEAGRVLDDLRRVARSRVVRPALGYRFSADGRLVPLEALPKESQGSTKGTMDATRKGFALSVEPKMLLRTPAGLGYVAGLFRVDAASLASGTPVQGTVVVEASSASGTVAARTERAFDAPVEEGGLVGSYGITLKPGRYDLRVAVRLASGQSSHEIVPTEVPDFAATGLKATPLLLYPDEADAGAAGPRDAFAALSLGTLRLRPRLGDRFATRDSLHAVALLFGGSPDPVTGRPSLEARFAILKDAKAVARGQDEVYDSEATVASIGPVPLTGFATGRYVVRLEAKDRIAGTTVVEERPFEIAE